MGLFQALLSPTLWSRPGYQPPLVRLLQAYMTNAPQVCALVPRELWLHRAHPHLPLQFTQQQLQPILGVFQKLLSSSQSDHLAFFLLESIFLSLPLESLQPYLSNILTLIFSRIQSNKTLKTMRYFIVFLAFFVGKHGAATVVQAIDSVQPKLFMMVMESIWLPTIQKVSGRIERKACAIAMIKLLTDCPPLLSETYFGLWPKLLVALMNLLELPQEDEGTSSSSSSSSSFSFFFVAHRRFRSFCSARGGSGG